MESRRLYLDSVAAHLRAVPQAKRDEILRELGDHLDDRKMALRAFGLQEEHAMQEAVADLGPADEVGQSLRLVHERGTWGQALLAALPFLVFALAASLPEWGSRPLKAVIVAATSRAAFYWLTFGTMYAAFLVGMAAGWLRNMPKWSYPYWGFWFVFTLWWSGIRSPRIVFHGWRAWIPGLALIGILTLIRRGLRPLATALLNAFRDWPLASLALHPAVAFVCWVSFDEVKATYEGPSLLLALLLCAAGAVGFIRSSGRWQRLSRLFGSAMAALSVTCAVTTYYWGQPLNWPFSFSLYAAYAVLIVLLIPGSVGLAEKVWRRRLVRD